MRITRLIRSGALLAVTAAVGFSLSTGTANAAIPPTSWNATGTTADVVGAHAWGTITPGPAAGTYVFHAAIKDTKADSHGARVNLRAACEGDCVSLVSVSTSGLDTTNSDDFTLKGPVTVQECLTEAGVDYICGEPYTITP
jgi:FlaG/FlaF family flagellin (archaellin)